MKSLARKILAFAYIITVKTLRRGKTDGHRSWIPSISLAYMLVPKKIFLVVYIGSELCCRTKSVRSCSPSSSTVSQQHCWLLLSLLCVLFQGTRCCFHSQTQSEFVDPVLECENTKQEIARQWEIYESQIRKVQSNNTDKNYRKNVLVLYFELENLLLK